jgi:hypothetical protein
MAVKELYGVTFPKVPARSTRHITVDNRYAEILADELEIKVSTARSAFIGEPQRRASEISGWALDKSDDPEERARMILAWARKNRRGAFRDLSDAELLRTVRERL